jgi:vacuolar protein-sorting-associated protein 4
MKSPSENKIIEEAERTISEIKQNKHGLRLVIQLEKLTEHVNNIMECKKIATPRSSLVINELLVLSEQLQTSSHQLSHESSVNTVPEKTSYQNENENDQNESWHVLKDTNVFFDEIQGCSEAIMDISESVVIPLKYPTIFKRSKSRRSTGILLYGPPGTGKSMIARATACEISATFFTASCAELTSRWVGGSEKKLKSLFETAVKNIPSIVFLDEIDSIAGTRGSESTIADQRLTNQLLIELDNISNQQLAVFVIAATNLPWQIDDAVMRRLSRKIYIPMPDVSARRLMLIEILFEILLKD